MKTVAPVENKTAVQTLTTAVVAIVSWLLTRYVGELDPGTSAIISGAASVGVGFVLAWLTKHTPRLENTIEEALQILAANGYQPGTAGSNVSAHEASVAELEASDDHDKLPPVDEIPEPSMVVPPSDIDTNA